MVFETFKQIFVKTFLLPDKRTLETFTVEFVDTKEVTVVRSFFRVGQCK